MHKKVLLKNTITKYNTMNILCFLTELAPFHVKKLVMWTIRFGGLL